MHTVVEIQSYCSAKGSAASSFSGPGPVPIARSVDTPAARARSSMASRSSANCGKSMCACEPISSRGGNCDCSATVGPRYIVPLLQAGADFAVFVGEAGEDGAAFRADGGGDDHAVGFDATQLARREIDDNGDFAANQFFRLIVLRDAGAHLPNFCANVGAELQQLVRANDTLRGLNLAYAHLDLGEILDADFFGSGGGGCRRRPPRCGGACGRRGGGARRRRRRVLLLFLSV